MANITARDVASFGRVLSVIAEKCLAQPKQVLELLGDVQETESTEVADTRFEELATLNLFDVAKQKERCDLVEFLQQFNVDQLRHLIRRYRLGAIKSKSNQALIEHIVDQLVKRQVDVFRDHE